MGYTKLNFLSLSVLFAALAADPSQAATVHLVGGSSVADFPASRAPLTGWGTPFKKTVASGHSVINHAISGASTKTYVGSTRWSTLLGQVRSGDYVLLHFAHNDEDQSKSSSTSQSEFQANLRKMVNDVRNKSATPILMTGVARLKFSSGRVVDSHPIYGPLLADVARSMNVSLVDTNKLSMDLLASLGQKAAEKLYLFFGPGIYPAYPNGASDETHFSTYGAGEISKLIVNDIKRQRLPMANILVGGLPAPAPVPPPAPAPAPAPVGSRPAVCASNEIGAVIDKSKLTDAGFRFRYVDAFGGAVADTATNRTLSKLRLFEGSKLLGPAHALEADVIDSGAGRYLHTTSNGSSVLLFSTSDNSSAKTNGRVYTWCAPDPTPEPAPAPAPAPVPAPPTPVPGTSTVQIANPLPSGCVAISMSSVSSDDGFAYRLRNVAGGDVGGEGSTLRLFENTRELGPAHTLHAEIREEGRGRFSHSSDNLRFSASDNSNPISNGRKYIYCMGKSPLVTVAAPAPAPAPAPAESRPAVCASTEIGAVIDKAKLTDAGFRFRYVDAFGGAVADTATNRTLSKLRLFEGSKLLGPAHALEADVIDSGAGRYLHTTSNGSSVLLFSTSDNSSAKTNGRVYTWCAPAAGSSPAPAPVPAPQPAPAPAPAPAPGSVSSKLIGFAAGTTGGGNLTPKVVTTFAALEAAAEATAPAVIHVKGVLKGSAGIRVKSNKSIIGLPGAVIEGAGLLIFGQTNVIIQNITFRNITASDAVGIEQKSSKVWVDHCTFIGPTADGLLDITSGADLVTVSWNRLSNASLASLVGASYTNKDDPGRLRVTYHHNLFTQITERGPKVSVGTGHVFNNYYLENRKSGSYQGYGIGSAAGAIVRAENNFFQDFQGVSMQDIKADGVPYGQFSAANTNIFRNSGAPKIRSSPSNWAPPYEYKSVLTPAEDVPEVVMKGAGAR